MLAAFVFFTLTETDFFYMGVLLLGFDKCLTRFLSFLNVVLRTVFLNRMV